MITVYDADEVKFGDLNDIHPIESRQMTFSGGEEYCRFDESAIKGKKILIDARVQNSQDLMRLMSVADALNGMNPKNLTLFMPYVPGGRQDHPIRGTPATLYMVGHMLRNFGFDRFIITDPHSKATVDNLTFNRRGTFEVIHPGDIIPKEEAVKYSGFVIVDKGAVPRATAAATALGIPDNAIICDKVRDQETGKIVGFKVTNETIADGHYLVPDDICDGGGTFEAVADAIFAKNPSVTLDLYTTFGIYSKGTEKLLKKYKRLLTSDGFPTTLLHHYAMTRHMNPPVIVFPLLPLVRKFL